MTISFKQKKVCQEKIALQLHCIETISFFTISISAINYFPRVPKMQCNSELMVVKFTKLY